MEPDAERRSYLLVDGENIDATLGQILSRRPQPQERPRWDRLLQFLEDTWQQPATGLFFLAVSGELPLGFVQALMAMGFRPVPLASDGTEKVVDIAIQRTLEELARRDADVVLASNDADFLPQLEPLVGTRRTALVAFHEFKSLGYNALLGQGLEFFDLEHDVQAFNEHLPRVRIIPLSEFDPSQFL